MIDCIVRLPANLVYAAIGYPPMVLLLVGVSGALLQTKLLQNGILPLLTYGVAINRIFYLAS